MQRYKSIIEYDGTKYFGWELQKQLPSVRQTLEEAVFKFSGEKRRVFCAGRTDSGVHATGQVIHFDLEKKITETTVTRALNFYLRNEQVTLHNTEQVDNSFHARHSAYQRHYKYLIWNSRTRTVLNQTKMWWVSKPLDINSLKLSSKYFLGTHDFSTFRDKNCSAKSSIRTLDNIEVTKTNNLIIIDVYARSFLHRQVRSMVGSLLEVGKSKWQPINILIALKAQNRTRCGPIAPPHGLYLYNIKYSKTYSTHKRIKCPIIL